MPKDRFLTRKQTELLKAIGPNITNWHLAPERLGMSSNTRDTHLSNIFSKYLQALELMEKYALVFESRIKIHDSKMRRANRRMRENLRRR